MATQYPKLSYGSSGASVRQLQQALNEAGYALDVDGSGALIVRYPDGTVGSVNSGEVSVRGMYGYL